MVSREITIVVSSLNGFVTRLIKKLVLDIVANLKAAPREGGTPVDTGWARSNWVPNIGSPIRKVAGSYAAAKAGNLSFNSAAGIAHVATSYNVKMGAVHITNNVPYILRLDAGSSMQAPAGFVRRGIVKAITRDLLRA